MMVSLQDRARYPYGEVIAIFRKALIAGLIMNKLMVMTWPASERADRPVGRVYLSELELLAEAEAVVPEPHKASIGNVRAKLNVGEEYPSLSDDAVLALGNALNQYGSLLPESKNAAAAFGIIDEQRGIESMVDALLSTIWGSIPPSMAPPLIGGKAPPIDIGYFYGQR